MEKTTKVVAWICILSTLLMGCSSSMLVQPVGDDKEKVYSREIEYVIAKDSTVFVFEKPPTVVNDAIVGLARVQSAKGVSMDKVSIPFSDVAQASLKKTNRPYVAVGVLVGVVFVITMVGLIASGGHIMK